MNHHVKPPRARITALPASLPPRGLTIQEAATYAGCKSVSAFRARIRRGLLPAAMPGTHAWDRKAIDRALDKASGISDIAAGHPSELDEWLAKRHARESERHPHRKKQAG